MVNDVVFMIQVSACLNERFSCLKSFSLILCLTLQSASSLKNVSLRQWFEFDKDNTSMHGKKKEFSK